MIRILSWLVVALGLALPGTATAVTVIQYRSDFVSAAFDSVPSGSAGSVPRLTLSPSAIVSEADLAATTSLDTQNFATSGDQGLISARGSSIVFSARRLNSVSVDVLVFPGGPAIQLIGVRDGQIVVVDETTGQIGDSGLVEARLSIHVRQNYLDWFTIQSSTCGLPSPNANCLVRTPEFFVDSLSLRVPEPGWLALAAFLPPLANRRCRAR